MQGVVPNTAEVLTQLSNFECVKSYIMIGGTALSLQIKHRLSEDIDFCKWKKTKFDKISVDCEKIEKELSKISEFKKEIISDNQVDYKVNNVKVTFFCDNKYKQPSKLKKINFLNNIVLADIDSICITKLHVMMYRSKFRDYYDIYSILKAGGDFENIIDGFLKYNYYNIRSRDILSMIADGTRFETDINLKHLEPLYDIKTREIETFLIPYINKYNNKK